jgi:DNA polymerase-3 subunit chi
MDYRFYHLQRSTVEDTLPKLLEKALQQSMRAVVVAPLERLKALDSYLWTYRPDSFLPHGMATDAYAADQPICLSPAQANPNDAKALFLLDGAELAGEGGFDICCDLFDGADPQSLEAARGRWKTLKEAGHTLTYWQQTERGGWEKQAGK